MPLYSYRCAKCGADYDHYNAVVDHARGPECCGQAAEQRITAPSVMVQAEAHYKCPVTGEQVTSRRRRQYIMDKHDLIDANETIGNKLLTDQRAAAAREGERQMMASLPSHARRDAERLLSTPPK
jgi:putative FmdB family regulatory protein